MCAEGESEGVTSRHGAGEQAGNVVEGKDIAPGPPGGGGGGRALSLRTTALKYMTYVACTDNHTCKFYTLYIHDIS